MLNKIINQIKNQIRNKRIFKIIILIIITILIFCFIMKNYFPAEWSFITPHKQGDFVRVGDMCKGRYYHKKILLNDGRVFIPGVRQSQFYNPKNRRFMVINNDCYLNDRAAIKLQNGNILVYGGGTNEPVRQEAYIFNPVKNKFKQGPKPITGREKHSFALLNDGRVFVSGGEYYNGKSGLGYRYMKLKSTEFYNPKTNKFEKGPDLPLALSEHESIKLDNGNILLIGGFRDTKEYLKGKFADPYNYDILEFNPKTNKIEKIGKLIQGRRAHSVFYIAPNKIYITEGVGPGKYNNSDNIDLYTSLRSIELFDYKNKTSKIIASRSSSAEIVNPVLLPNNTILYPGGSSGFGIGYTGYKSVLVFDTKLNRFTNLNTKSSIALPASMSILLDDGNVLITGGGNNGSKRAVIYMTKSKIKR